MTPYFEDHELTMYVGDVREVLRELPDESVHCVVTSPPYFGLRDYGVDGQLGLEPTPAAYVEALVEVFREVRRVLRRDGTVWLNLGDSYAGSWGAQGHRDTPAGLHGNQIANHPKRSSQTGTIRQSGLKVKDRMGIPHRVVFALQADGWWWRDEIVWHKPNPMPSSVADRTTPAHEFMFLLTRSRRYAYDAEAIREEATTTRPELLKFGDERPDRNGTGRTNDRRRQKVPGGWDIEPGAHGTRHRGGRTEATYRERNVGGRDDGFTQMPGGEAEWAENGRPGRNKRSVWTIATQPFPEAHFATFPEKLVEPCILAGSPKGGVVLDPFGGSGTVALVANRLGRRAIHVDLGYMAMALRRVRAAWEVPA